jgi:hypothetical protein
MNNVLIFISIFVIISEIIYIYIRKVTSDDYWLNDKMGSTIASAFITLIIFMLFQYVIYSVLTVLGIAGFFLANYLLDRFILNKGLYKSKK